MNECATFLKLWKEKMTDHFELQLNRGLGDGEKRNKYLILEIERVLTTRGENYLKMAC